jgi:hypothetical protein
MMIGASPGGSPYRFGFIAAASFPKTPSFTLEVGELLDSKLPLRVSNASETVEVQLLFERVSGRPPIYHFQLPYALTPTTPDWTGTHFWPVRIISKSKKSKSSRSQTKQLLHRNAARLRL